MIISNELVNELIRSGDSEATFSIRPRIEDIVDERGRFRQVGNRIPLLDAIRALIVRGRSLFPALIHPSGQSGLSVNRDAWEALILSLERYVPPQDDLVDPSPVKIANEVSVAHEAYEAARKVIAAHEANPRLSMDAFVSLMKDSPNAELSKSILCQAAPGNTGWITATGALGALEHQVPPTMVPERNLEIRGCIRDVDDAAGIALVELTDYRDAYAREMLAHHTSRIPMSFDKEALERDDLLVLQYHEVPVWFRVSAECAVASRHARKTCLALSRILVGRAALDAWHAQARQISLVFDEG